MLKSFKLLTIIVLTGLLLSGCNDGVKKSALPEPLDIIKSGEVSIPVYDFNTLEPLFSNSNGKTYVINFWASWCKPCIKEMPYFEKAGEKYRDKGVQIILVSLDFESQVKEKLIPYLVKNSIKNKVVLLSDPDANSWIPKVDSSWTGAIPATLIFNDKKKAFYEQSFTYEELENLIESFN